MHTSILIIEDDELLAATFQRFLRGAGYQTDCADGYDTGRERLLSGIYSTVIMDINLQGNKTGIDLLRELRECNLTIPVVIITGAPDVVTATASVRHAAFDYLCKPVEKEPLLTVVQAAVRHKAQQDEKEQQYKNLESAFNRIKIAVGSVDCSDTLATMRPDNRDGVLSERERQILALLADGESTSYIAEHFTLSARTVESYYARIMNKLGLDGMKALRRYAIKNKKHG